jgi:membrane associated rhomboid family serine protease
VFLGIFITVTELPAVVMLGLWFALQCVEGIVSVAARPGVGGVAWFAHVGGFVFGVGVAWIMRTAGGFRSPDPRHQIWYRH